MSTVNKDYICIIKNVNGCVKFVKEEIRQKTDLMIELKAMVENPNMTILDLQSRMDREFIPSAPNFIDYLIPYSYSSANVEGVSYPQAPSHASYTTKIEKSRDVYTDMYKKNFEPLKSKSLQEFNAKVVECVEREIAYWVKREKEYFYDKCEHFCQAYSYASLLRELKSDPDVKMWSTDTVGWTILSYQITDDIRIDVYTNFGYGSSSYFYLGLTYKGIDILPYSMFVKYYYADRRDIVRYTQLYETKRDSWNDAFVFVEEVANKAAEGDEPFLTKYVMDEVQGLLSLMRNILEDPKAYFDTNIASKNEENESPYLTVHNMTRYERNTYKVYPEEIIDVFQAEKIAGALEFLEKISALKPIYEQATEAADEIRSLAHSLLPQLEKNMARIAADVERLQAKEDELSLQIEALDRDIEPFTARIDELYEEKCCRAKEGETINRSDVENEYADKHPEYAALRKKRNEKSDMRSRVYNDKSARQSFHSRLKLCMGQINSIQ